MALAIYKGKQASRQYENKFFREFAQNLVSSKIFDDEDAILVGFPKIIGRSDFCPDALLITHYRLIIIDFKKYNGRLILPSEDNFRTGDWLAGGVVVKGGSQINPFAQASRNIDLCKDEFSISEKQMGACVCFGEQIFPTPEIPGRYAAWFSIADKFSYPNIIQDQVDLHGDFDARYIDFEAIRKNYLEAAAYQEIEPIDFERYRAAAAAYEKLDAAEATVIQLEEKIKRLEARPEQPDFSGKLDDMQHRLDELYQERNKLKQNAEAKKRDYEMLQAEAQVAEAKRQTAENDLERAKVEQKTEITRSRRQIFITAVAVAFCAALIIGIFLMIEHFNRQAAEQKAREAEEALLSGRTCFDTVSQLAPYDDAIKSTGLKDVCYIMRVASVSSNKYYTYLLDASKYTNAKFEVVADSAKFPKDTMNAKYYNHNIKVRGTITFYDKYYQIKISDESAIEITK